MFSVTDLAVNSHLLNTQNTLTVASTYCPQARFSAAWTICEIDTESNEKRLVKNDYCPNLILFTVQYAVAG